jgi:hypothetical protein
MHFNREFVSNELDESDMQFDKQDDPRLSTRHEIRIVQSAEPEKAHYSIRLKLEFASK